jgi:hypothetical protein
MKRTILSGVTAVAVLGQLLVPVVTRPMTTPSTTTSAAKTPPPAGTKRMVTWSGPNVNTDGTPASLARFQIDAAPSMYGPWRTAASIAAPASTYTLTYAPGEQCVRVSAISTRGVVSLAQWTCEGATPAQPDYVTVQSPPTQ